MPHDVIGGRLFRLFDPPRLTELPPGGRRSGRTYRMLEATLKEIRNGKRVAVVMGNGAERQGVLDMLQKMGATPAELQTLKIYSGDPSIQLRGTPWPIYEDHYAISDGDNQQGVRHPNAYSYVRARSLRPKR